MKKNVSIYSLAFFLLTQKIFPYNVTLHNAYNIPVTSRVTFRCDGGELTPMTKVVAPGVTETLHSGVGSGECCLQWVDIKDAQGNLLDLFVASTISPTYPADLFFVGNFNSTTKTFGIAAKKTRAKDWYSSRQYIETPNVISQDTIDNTVCNLDMHFVFTPDKRLALLRGSDDVKNAKQVVTPYKVRQLGEAIEAGNQNLIDRTLSTFASDVKNSQYLLKNINGLYTEGRDVHAGFCPSPWDHSTCEYASEGGEMSPFVKAIQKNNEALVERFLNLTDSAVDKPLRRWNEDLEDAAPYLQYPLDYATGAIKNKLEPLVMARRNAVLTTTKDDEALIQQIRYGMKLDISDDQGRTPLMNAAKNNLPGIAKALIDAQVNINAQDKVGATALTIAHAYRNKTVADLIKAAGGLETMPATAFAVLVNNGKLLEQLKNAGIDINTQDNQKRTALTLALLQGNNELAQIIRTLGGKEIGTTALIEAVKKGDLAQVTQLIATGIDINARDSNEMTALMHAAFNNKADIIATLVEKGADLTLKDNQGRTALGIAQKQNAAEASKKLYAAEQRAAK